MSSELKQVTHAEHVKEAEKTVSPIALTGQGRPPVKRVEKKLDLSVKETVTTYGTSSDNKNITTRQSSNPLHMSTEIEYDGSVLMLKVFNSEASAIEELSFDKIMLMTAEHDAFGNVQTEDFRHLAPSAREWICRLLRALGQPEQGAAWQQTLATMLGNSNHPHGGRAKELFGQLLSDDADTDSGATAGTVASKVYTGAFRGVSGDDDP